MKRKFKLDYKRKLEGLTDYKKRIRLLSSKKLRFVVRITLNSINTQIIEFNTKGDKVIVSANSNQLKKFGYNLHTGNIPAAYLTGVLLGLKSKHKGIKEAILDTGLKNPTPQSTLYSAMKGAIDAGIKIPHNEETLKETSRFKGKHIEEYAKHLNKNDPEKYKKQFSKYLKNNINPEHVTKLVEEIKNKILSS